MKVYVVGYWKEYEFVIVGNDFYSTYRSAAAYAKALNDNRNHGWPKEHVVVGEFLVESLSGEIQ